ncbi:MAG TPA: ferredoxin [Phycisphaerae bacterium]|nr:ferredoxin [Phycisphaerae bacterium]HRR84969.1 ferredoxin [Phycisphaerae bacterium]
MAEVNKVSIDASECISCEACVDACPDVFEMGKDAAVVKAGADIQANSDGIVSAAEACPTSAIKYE